MLKKRLIASLVLKDAQVVQSIGFSRYLPIGSLKICVENLNRFGIDEIVIIDIDATKKNQLIDTDLVKEAAKYSFVPLSVGGGIKTIKDIELLMHSGADKVVINQAFWQNPQLIKKSSDIFGNQCIVVSMDAYEEKCYDYITQNKRDKTVLEAAQKAISLGAGEILLNSVQRDGIKKGMDIESIQYLANSLSIPLIAQGGVGNTHHIKEAFRIKNLSAVAVGNFFHFIEHSVNITKGVLASATDIPIRNEAEANYKDAVFDEELRVAKKSDEELRDMLFEYHKAEII